MRECNDCQFTYKGNSLSCPRCGSTNTSPENEGYDFDEDDEVEDTYDDLD